MIAKTKSIQWRDGPSGSLHGGGGGGYRQPSLELRRTRDGDSLKGHHSAKSDSAIDLRLKKDEPLPTSQGKSSAAKCQPTNQRQQYRTEVDEISRPVSAVSDILHMEPDQHKAVPAVELLQEKFPGSSDGNGSPRAGASSVVAPNEEAPLIQNVFVTCHISGHAQTPSTIKNYSVHEVHPHKKNSHPPNFQPFSDVSGSPSSLMAPTTPQPLPASHIEDNNVSNALVSKDWAKIKKLRLEIWSQRSKVQEMRRILRDKQLTKSEADNKYFQYMRLHSLGQLDGKENIAEIQKRMADFFEACEVARNDYGPYEDDCNILENRLGTQEFKLLNLEEKFYEHHIEHYADSIISLANRAETSTNSSNSSSYSGSETDMRYHPAVSKFLSKLGDIEITRERLEWLIEEKENLEEKKATRKRISRELASEDKQWLDEYEATYEDLNKELIEAEAEAEILGKECYDKKLIDEDGEPTDFELQERRAFEDDKLDAKSQSSSFIEFPKLIPHPGSKKFQFHNARLDAEESSQNSRSRVDIWLLHQLKMSPLQVHLLASMYEITSGHDMKREETGKWQGKVLALWFDDAEENGWGVRSASSGFATQAPGNVEYAASSSAGKTETQSWGILIRSSKLVPANQAPEVSQNQTGSERLLLDTQLKSPHSV